MSLIAFHFDTAGTNAAQPTSHEFRPRGESPRVGQTLNILFDALMKEAVRGLSSWW